MSSPKGRILGPLTARRERRSGVCAWCGETYIGSLAALAACPRCGSEEIDWDPAPAPQPTHQHFADTHIPGSIAFSLLGGFVRGGSR